MSIFNLYLIIYMLIFMPRAVLSSVYLKKLLQHFAELIDVKDEMHCFLENLIWMGLVKKT